MTTFDYIVAHTPRSGWAVAPSLLKARQALDAAGRELVAVPDDALERNWRWRDADADVRYGVFRSLEAVEAATGAIATILAATGASRGVAAERVAPSTVARWDLHGRLVALDDSILDRVGREGEWTVRETLGHIVGGQRGYVAFTAWYLTRDSDDPPADEERERVQAETALPEESEEGAGSLDEIRARFDEAVDLGTHFAGVPDAGLAKRAFWSGIPVDIAFRIGRWSSHALEHTIQIDKTLDWLDRRPTEAERIVGDLYRAWGRLESRIFPIEPAALTASDGSGRSIESVLDSLGEDLVGTARSTRAAAEA
jgi:hypothetical protein